MSVGDDTPTTEADPTVQDPDVAAETAIDAPVDAEPAADIAAEGTVADTKLAEDAPATADPSGPRSDNEPTIADLAATETDGPVVTADDEDDAAGSILEVDAGEPELSEEDDPKKWYALMVTSNREDSICASILRRLAMRDLSHFVDDLVVPKEKVTEIKGGKKRTVTKKFFPGYVIVHCELDDEVWMTVRETPGVVDFVGVAGKPEPITKAEADRMLGRQKQAEETEKPIINIGVQQGDRVKVNEGPFENFEGEVSEVNEAKGLVKVNVMIFGRTTSVELEYWQIDAVE